MAERHQPTTYAICVIKSPQSRNNNTIITLLIYRNIAGHKSFQKKKSTYSPAYKKYKYTIPGITLGRLNQVASE